MGKRVKKPWTATEVEELKDLRSQGLTRRQIAEALGRPNNSFPHKIQSLGGQQEAPQKNDGPTDQKFTHVTKGDQSNIISISEKIRTPAQALESAQIDLDVWEGERTTVNSWISVWVENESSLLAVQKALDSAALSLLPERDAIFR